MTFNYDMIPDGFYDNIFEAPDGMRKFWHWHKFDSVARTITTNKPTMALLDVGCFSGSFAGRFLDEEKYKSTSIDILKSQIKFAQTQYGSNQRKFFCYQNFNEAKSKLNYEQFDVVTFIEVIEHLDQEQIRDFFEMVDVVTSKGAQLIITTPNYISLWPFLEILLNRISDIKYEEQHITKFNYFNFKKKISKIYPEFGSKYKASLLTSSHFLTPYISILNYRFAQWLSRFYSPASWRGPLGSILILKLEKR